MSDDLLERATRALRETSAEPQPRSGLTRARILDSAQKRHAPRGVIVRWLLAASAVLAASTALARVAEHWPELKELLAPATEPAKRAPQSARRVQPTAATSAAPASPALQPLAPAGGAALVPDAEPQGSELGERATTSVPAEQASRTQRARALRGSRSSTSTVTSTVTPTATATATDAAASSAVSTTAAPVSEVVPIAESAELSLFRRAQRLHLAHDPGAVAAWDAYLRIAGQGVLAPEARYNRALALVRQGRIAEARHALGMFARGELGNYRRVEAQRLLAALADQPDRR
jgi:hypothetical protein